jgi:methionyl-tRNA formyltransferase
MKIQILISKSSWANKYNQYIYNQLSKYSKKIIFLNNHLKLKKKFDVNIIFSYFSIIPNKFLKNSKYNIIPHESDLPKGIGMSPLTWQILENKKSVIFSLIEANEKVDSGNIYFKKKVFIPKNTLFNDIKKIQLKNNLLIIKNFLKYFSKNKTSPKSILPVGKKTFYKKRTPLHSKLNVNQSLKKQFNLLRVADNKNYPAYFYMYGKKYLLKIIKK